MNSPTIGMFSFTYLPVSAFRVRCAMPAPGLDDPCAGAAVTITTKRAYALRRQHRDAGLSNKGFTVNVEAAGC
jgi:hypothetical protein